MRSVRSVPEPRAGGSRVAGPSGGVLDILIDVVDVSPRFRNEPHLVFAAEPDGYEMGCQSEQNLQSSPDGGSRRCENDQVIRRSVAPIKVETR